MMHITCSCIFHAYISFLFFLFVLFMMCFLFLSQLDCAWHLTFVFLSSNPPIPPLHVQFCDEKAYQDFLENFSKRGVHSKCHVILLDFSDTPLPDVIHTWGWESLCEIPLRCPTVFIHEFYSNMHGINTSMP